MSIAALNWAWHQDCPNATAKLVLIALADRADDDGVCWPRMDTVAERAGVSPRQVSTHLKALEDMGLLTRKRRRRGDGTLGSYTYTLLHRQQTLAPPEVSRQWKSTASGSATSPPPEAERSDHRKSASGQEPPRDPKGESTLGAGKPPRKRDLIFETLVEVSGWKIDNLTKNERGRTNTAAKQLREVGLTPADIRARAKAHRAKWPHLDVTPTSLASNNSVLESVAPKLASVPSRYTADQQTAMRSAHGMVAMGDVDGAAEHLAGVGLSLDDLERGAA